MKTFKVVCTDIDGTLLDHNRQLSSRTINVFRKLPDDVLVVLASSRMPAAMRHLQTELGLERHPIIAYNGGYVVQYLPDGNTRVANDEQIPLSVVQAILEQSVPSIHVSLFHKDEWYAPSFDSWADREATITKVSPLIASPSQTLSQWEAEGKGAHKVMCMGPEADIHELGRILNEKLSDDIHVYRSRPTYLELAPASISKGQALELLLNESKLAMADVVSFGDNYNDIELLRMSGHGVAVENALVEVKAVASAVTHAGKQDGVARALEELFGLG